MTMNKKMPHVAGLRLKAGIKILALLAMVLAWLPAQALTTAERADSAYNATNYRDAVRLYTEALKQSGPNTTLYYNLANSYYRLGQTGQAVANYERALRIDPSNRDAAENLRFVQSKIGNLPEDDSSFLGNLHYSIIALMSPDCWAVAGIVMTMLLIGMIAMYIFGNGVVIRKTGFFGAIVLLFLTVYTLVVAWQASTMWRSHDDAVVMVDTNLNTEPHSPRSATDKLIPVPEGAVLHIIDSLATPNDPQAPKWYDVKINNSTRAWVNASHVERI